jgi:hypothetical protein
VAVVMPHILSQGAVALADRGWLETGQVTAHRAASVFAGFRFRLR